MVFFRSWREEDESCMTYAYCTIVPKQVLHAFREDGIFTETSNGVVEEYPGDFGMHICLVEIPARAQELVLANVLLLAPNDILIAWARLGKKALILQLYRFQFSSRGQLLKDFKELRGIPPKISRTC